MKIELIKYTKSWSPRIKNSEILSQKRSTYSINWITKP